MSEFLTFCTTQWAKDPADPDMQRSVREIAASFRDTATLLRLAEHHDTTVEVRTALRADPDPGVRAAGWRHGRAAAEELAEVVGSREKNQQVRFAVLARPDVPEHVADMVVGNMAMRAAREVVDNHAHLPVRLVHAALRKLSGSTSLPEVAHCNAILALAGDGVWQELLLDETLPWRWRLGAAEHMLATGTLGPDVHEGVHRLLVSYTEAGSFQERHHWASRRTLSSGWRNAFDPVLAELEIVFGALDRGQETLTRNSRIATRLGTVRALRRTRRVPALARLRSLLAGGEPAWGYTETGEALLHEWRLLDEQDRTEDLAADILVRVLLKPGRVDGWRDVVAELTPFHAAGARKAAAGHVPPSIGGSLGLPQWLKSDWDSFVAVYRTRRPDVRAATVLTTRERELLRDDYLDHPTLWPEGDRWKVGLNAVPADWTPDAVLDRMPAKDLFAAAKYHRDAGKFIATRTAELLSRVQDPATLARTVDTMMGSDLPLNSIYEAASSLVS